MTDIIKSENNVPIRFADMGDGTYAEVTATNLFASGANFNLIGDGKSLTSTGTSVSTLIPFDPTSLLAAGSVRVAVTDPGYIRIENTEAAASATDILVNPEDSILINTEGKRFISFVSLVGEATANIQPVGNNSFKMFESSLDLNFLSNEYVFNNDFVSFSSIATFSRNSAATFVGSNGLIQSAPANTPRFDYDPVTLQPRGFLIEEQRTNLLLNSAAPTTQNITVAAVQYTLAFYGTGTVTLSGAATATVAGTGAFPTRTTTTFTPTAGTLTVTITGTVQFANLETGAFATSWIPTTTAAATRLADSAKIDGANFAAFYKQSEGTLMAEFIPSTATNTQFAAAISDNTFNNRFSISRAVDGLSRFRLFRNSVSQDAFAGVALANNTLAKIAYAFNQTGGSRAVNGATATSFTTSPPVGPVADRIYIGADEAGSGVGATNGHIRRIMYIPKRLSNTELQALTI